MSSRSSPRRSRSFETPPSPRRRAIAAAIILLFCAALAWSAWGTIDVVASASGKILPSGRTKMISRRDRAWCARSGAGRASRQRPATC